MKIALFVLLGLVGLIVVGAIVAGPKLSEGLAALAPAEQGTKVRMETVATRNLIETIKAPGKIEPHTKVEISAEVSARIEALPFREGEIVKKGEVVVKLDDRDLKAGLAATEARRDGEAFRLQSEQARLTGMLSTLSFAKKELERKQHLFDTGDLSRQDLDNAMQRTDDLQAQVEAIKHTISVIESSLAGAKADIDQSQQMLAKTVIIAPMDGVITLLNAEVGEVVLVGTMNNPGTVIMTIADLSRMILKAEVAETDIATLARSKPAFRWSAPTLGLIATPPGRSLAWRGLLRQPRHIHEPLLVVGDVQGQPVTVGAAMVIDDQFRRPGPGLGVPPSEFRPHVVRTELPARDVEQLAQVLHGGAA